MRQHETTTNFKRAGTDVPVSLQEEKSAEREGECWSVLHTMDSIVINDSTCRAQKAWQILSAIPTASFKTMQAKLFQTDI